MAFRKALSLRQRLPYKGSCLRSRLRGCMKDDLPWMLDAAVRTGLRDFRRRELHIRAVRLRRRLLGAAARFWRFRDGRLTGSRAQRRADHAARLLRRAARPGRILKLMADEGGQRFQKKTPPHLGCAEAAGNIRGNLLYLLVGKYGILALRPRPPILSGRGVK